MTRTPTHRLRTVAVAAALAILSGPAMVGTATAAPLDPCPPASSTSDAPVPPATPTSTAIPTATPTSTPTPTATAPAPTVQPGPTLPVPPADASTPSAGEDPGGDPAQITEPTDEPEDGSGDDSGDSGESGDESADDTEALPAPADRTPEPPATTTPAAPEAPASATATPQDGGTPPGPALPALPGVPGVTAPLLGACESTDARPYFPKADWLWGAVPQNPVLDPDSTGMVEGLASGDHIANIGDFGVTLRGPDGITAATPRFPVTFSETGNWGPDPFGGETMPIPLGTPIAPGSDGHLAVADPVTDKVYNVWMAKDGGDAWTAGWGAITPLSGDGRETNGSSTGAGIARFAAVVRQSEIEAGVIPHALFFSTNMAAPGEFRYPATKTDGSNMDGLPTPIPEGARIQLDPTLDVDALPGLTPAERTVAKALQTYGAYCGDNGGARMAFLFEYAPDTSTYADNGLTGSYASLENIPFDKLRVLANWDGQAPGENPLPAPAGS